MRRSSPDGVPCHTDTSTALGDRSAHDSRQDSGSVAECRQARDAWLPLRWPWRPRNARGPLPFLLRRATKDVLSCLVPLVVLATPALLGLSENVSRRNERKPVDCG